MPENTQPPAFAWARTGVPPLRADLDRQQREVRRSIRAMARAGWIMLTGALTFAATTVLVLTFPGVLS